ncbi:NADPH-dependent F420 reductase [Streptomyces sp. NPDC091377]|uniref:NADPH-dependent F420 reductase n=1 Tax=Streptomyces sp. NPDC091377 TaxID=3365995 RepID=UPI003812495D
MRIGILGTGHVARALAPAWTAAGHDVLLGSRDPGARSALGLPVATVRDAAVHAEVVVNATPGTESLGLLGEIGEAVLAGKVIIDCAVGFRADESLAHPEEPLGAQIQRAFPSARVVKTLATVNAPVMAEPTLVAGPSHLFVSGDDPEAKRLTVALLTDLGWAEDTLLDIGGISTAAAQEHAAYLFVAIARHLGDWNFGLRVVPSR